MQEDHKKNFKNNQQSIQIAKVILLGDDNVGKTSLLNQFFNNTFTDNTLITIGIDFRKKTLNIQGNNIKLIAWDTAGQEKYKSVTSTYFKGAHGIILTYSCNDRQSFENIENWMKFIKEQSIDNLCILLVGNKCDVTNKVVSTEEGQNIAKKYGINFLETSAKANFNITECFTTLSRDVYNQFLQKASTQTLSFSLIDNSRYKKSGCC